MDNVLKEIEKVKSPTKPVLTAKIVDQSSPTKPKRKKKRKKRRQTPSTADGIEWD